MIFIWGKKVVQKKAGFRAEFCPICRDVKAHFVKELVEVSHLYYIPMGRGTKEAYRIICEGCKSDYYDTESEHLDTIAAPDPLTELVRTTNPEMVEELSDRMNLERQISENPMSLSEEDREGLIIEPFLHLAGSLEVDAKGSTKIDGFMLKCFAGWVAYTGLTIALVPWLSTIKSLNRQLRQFGMDIIGAVAISIGVVALLLLVWCMITKKKRHLNRHVLPLLARSLRPLQPSREELAETIEYICEMDLEIGKVDADELAQQMEENIW
ncbi:MAG: hypothetical protein QF437_12110, partial [Planctomycetota bacterium]|nr:hypothetical protein [Planctomycetota bacterium]